MLQCCLPTQYLYPGISWDEELSLPAQGIFSRNTFFNLENQFQKATKKNSLRRLDTKQIKVRDCHNFVIDWAGTHTLHTLPGTNNHPKTSFIPFVERKLNPGIFTKNKVTSFMSSTLRNTVLNMPH